MVSCGTAKTATHSDHPAVHDRVREELDRDLRQVMVVVTVRVRVRVRGLGLGFERSWIATCVGMTRMARLGLGLGLG